METLADRAVPRPRARGARRRRTSTSPRRRRCCSSSRSTAAAGRPTRASASRSHVRRAATPDRARREPAAPRVARARLRRRRADEARIATGCTATAATATTRRCSPASTACSRMFADCARCPAPRHDEADAETRWLRSPQEHLHAYLRSLDAEAEGLPDALRGAAARARSPTTAIDDLDRTPALEEAATACSSPSSAPRPRAPAVVAILDRRLEHADALRAERRRRLPRGARPARARPRERPRPGGRRPRPRGALPLLRRAGHRGRARARLRRDGASTSPRWPRTPTRADRDERIAALVACPRPLAPLLTARMRAPAPALRRLLVEAMTRRYYRIRAARGLRPRRLDGHACCSPRYRYEGRARHLAAAFVDLDELAGALARARAPRARDAARAATWPSRPLRVAGRDRRADATLAARCARRSRRSRCPARCTAIVVAVARPSAAAACRRSTRSRSGPTAEGLVEDEVVRGLHPMMAAPAATCGGCENFDARAAALGRGRLPVPRRRARATRRTSGCSRSPRCATSRRCATSDGRVAALPELERMLVRGARGDPRASRRAARRAGGCSGTASCSTCGRSIELRPEEIDAVMQRAGAARPLGLGIETCCVRGRLREPDGDGARARAALLHARRARASSSRSATRRREPLQPLDEGARRIVAARRRGIAAPGRDRQAAGAARARRGHPAGEFVEHDLDDDGAARAGRPPAGDQPRRASSSA